MKYIAIVLLLLTSFLSYKIGKRTADGWWKNQVAEPIYVLRYSPGGIHSSAITCEVKKGHLVITDWDDLADSSWPAQEHPLGTKPLGVVGGIGGWCGNECQ